MQRAALSILVVALSSLAVRAAEGRDVKPFELVRELQDFQNQAALAGGGARAEQRAKITEVAARLAKFDASVWAEPKNARAAVIYVLGGGDPSVLRKLVGSGVAFGVDDQLVKGALAYGERRDDEATKLLGGVDIDLLDRGIGGHVALVRALLAAKSAPRNSFALLGKARLLAPGSIVEEAALRRQAILAAKMGDLNVFEALSSQYFRRFPTSIFARSFERQFAQDVVARGYAPDAKRAANLEALLRGLSDGERRETCLAIAEEGIATGNVEIVRFAARIAAIDAKSKPLDAIRMRLFEAAAVIVTSDYEEGSKALWSIDRSKLGVREEALLDAALSVAREVSRPPAPPRGGEQAEDSAAAPAPGAAVDDSSSRLIQDAGQAMARVDGLLGEAAK